ncbi:MAG: RusA family crossover junction endodeoxyribonuclease [Planctomycetota bacterium]|nr:MAG: RusA family crossover junction endodeoxyribonuclease [Planctomycetota bacterium]
MIRFVYCIGWIYQRFVISKGDVVNRFLLSLVIPGTPVGKQRPRSGKWGVFYTPKKTKNYEALIKMTAANKMQEQGLEILDCPVYLIIRAFYPIPESWSKKKKALAESGDILPTVRPDLDNIEKAVLDGLQGVVFKDDKQVVEVLKRKVYTSTYPRIEVTVKDWTEIIF